MMHDSQLIAQQKRRFRRTADSEHAWQVAPNPVAQAENDVARYIDGFYNLVRRHSLLGFQSPSASERKPREASETRFTKTGKIQARADGHAERQAAFDMIHRRSPGQTRRRQRAPTRGAASTTPSSNASGGP